MTGNTSYQRDKNIELRTATYQEAYTSWEKREEISYTSWEKKDEKGNPFPQEKTVKEKIVPVTRYRTKEFSYPITIFKENYDVKLEGRFEHPQFNTSFSFSDSPNNRTETHDVTMVEARVYPVSASFLNPRKIADVSIQIFASKLVLQLQEDWIAQYCNSFSNEAIHRCSHAAPFDKNVNLWYQKHFGVDYEEFRKITKNHRQ